MASPTLAVTKTSLPSISKGASSERTTRLAMRRTSSWVPRRVSSSVNSSPPWRASAVCTVLDPTESVSRRQPTMRFPTSRSSSSPAACPRLSLIRLKPSRSTTPTATSESSRFACSIARSTRDRYRRWFGRPVTASKDASLRWCSRVSPSTRRSIRKHATDSSTTETKPANAPPASVPAPSGAATMWRSTSAPRAISGTTAPSR